MRLSNVAAQYYARRVSKVISLAISFNAYIRNTNWTHAITKALLLNTTGYNRAAVPVAFNFLLPNLKMTKALRMHAFHTFNILGKFNRQRLLDTAVDFAF